MRHNEVPNHKYKTSPEWNWKDEPWTRQKMKLLQQAEMKLTLDLFYSICQGSCITQILHHQNKPKQIFTIHKNKYTICIGIIFYFTLLNWTRSSVCQNSNSQHCVLCPRPVTYFSSIACHFLLLYPQGSHLWIVWPGSLWFCRGFPLCLL